MQKSERLPLVASEHQGVSAIVAGAILITALLTGCRHVHPGKSIRDEIGHQM